MVKATSVFDLGSLDTIEACNKPKEIEIKHPVSRVGTGIFWSFVGKDSDIYRGRVRGMADENLRRAGPVDQTIDKLEAKNVDALVAATTGFRTGEDPAVVLRGERLEFNAANARRILMEILPIREQVSEGINDLGNFMPA